MDWTPVPHLDLGDSWALLALVLDLGIYVIALGALASVILGLQRAGRAFAKGWREGYNETRHG